MGKRRTCSSNGKVGSRGRAAKQSGGVLDTDLQNKRRRKPSVILTRKWTQVRICRECGNATRSHAIITNPRLELV